MDGMTKPAQKQVLTVTDRRILRLGGVSFVHSFDEESVTLSTADGRVGVEGHDLKIESLTKETGEIVIVGSVEGVFFSDKKDDKPRGRFGRGNR